TNIEFDNNVDANAISGRLRPGVSDYDENAVNSLKTVMRYNPLKTRRKRTDFNKSIFSLKTAIDEYSRDSTSTSDRASIPPAMPVFEVNYTPLPSRFREMHPKKVLKKMLSRKRPQDLYQFEAESIDDVNDDVSQPCDEHAPVKRKHLNFLTIESQV
ncbi:hypothetical protein EGW08_020752, partial [Elysia chlorotica]